MIENDYAKIPENCDNSPPNPLINSQKQKNPPIPAPNAPALKTAQWAGEAEETQQFVFFDMEDST